MQARQRDVGRGVRIVDGVDLAAAHDRLARVELPAEERVDRARDGHDLVALFRRQEVVSHLVAVVQRPRRIEPHHHCLGTDREAAREHLEVLDRRLHVHQLLARLVIPAPQRVFVTRARHPAPLPAVERLQVEREADTIADVGKVERLVVAGGRRRKALVPGWLLVRDQPGIRNLQAEPHHCAVRGMLLHRLEGERIVEQVDVVHQRDLLQPLAR